MVELLSRWDSFLVFQGIYYLLISFVGIPANLLTIFVLSCRPCGMSKTTVTYLLSLSVVDTLFMILGGLVDVTLSWSHPYPLQSCSDALLCGIITFNEYWTLSSSQWIVAAFMPRAWPC